jgi:hypothetical protein
MRPAHSTPRSVNVRDDLVEKHVPPDTCALEVARYKAAREVSLEQGGFDVPEVLNWNESTGLITLERIQEVRALRDWLRRGRNDPTALHQAGRTLGCLHKHMRLPDAYARLDPVQPNSPAENHAPVVLHGDYSAMNVCWSGDRNRIVVLDWGPVLSGGVKTCGPRYYDLGLFVASLIRIWPWWVAVRRFTRRTDLFIRGYAETAGAVDWGLLRRYVLRFTDGYARRRLRAAARRPTPTAIRQAVLHGICHVCALLLTFRWADKATGISDVNDQG